MAYNRAEKAILREFGRRVRAARGACGWSQEDLAAAASVDRTYVGAIERGERNLSLLNINKLSVALDENFDDFFPYKGSHGR